MLSPVEVHHGTFTDAAQKSFEALKTAFTTAPTNWILDCPIIVKTDASDYALGTILSIQTNSGEIHPIAFHSCTFSSPELNYDTHDKELLAIFKAFCVWWHYWKTPVLPLTLSWITRTLSISLLLKF